MRRCGSLYGDVSANRRAGQEVLSTAGVSHPEATGRIGLAGLRVHSTRIRLCRRPERTLCAGAHSHSPQPRLSARWVGWSTGRLAKRFSPPLVYRSEMAPADSGRTPDSLHKRQPAPAAENDTVRWGRRPTAHGLCPAGGSPCRWPGVTRWPGRPPSLCLGLHRAGSARRGCSSGARTRQPLAPEQGVRGGYGAMAGPPGTLSA